MIRPQERQSNTSSTYMSASQKADYLKDLRSPRPTGSRPPPPSRYNHDSTRSVIPIRNIVPDEGRPGLQQSNSAPFMSTQQSSRIWSRSSLTGNARGQPLAQAPKPSPVDLKSESTKQSRLAYLENGTRWMEKQETRSVRQALSDMDHAEKQRIHKAAQDEASELVWRHKNPDDVYRNPDARKDYKAHLRKGSYQRSAEDTAPVVASRSSSGSSNDGQFPSSGRKRLSLGRKVSPTSTVTSATTNEIRKTSASSKPYGELADLVRKDISESRRRTSSGSSRRLISGGKKHFMHPDDKIWEDAEEPPRVINKIPDLQPSASTPIPAYTRKNPFARMRMQQDRLERSNSAPLLGQQTLAQPVKQDRVEIQRNPPSQSRNAEYTTSQELQSRPPQAQNDVVVRERREDDIRAATSKLRSDRSPNLPQPTLVSDKANRPIVSFQQQKEIVLQQGEATRSSFDRANFEREPHVPPSSRDSQPQSRPSSSATTIVKPFLADVPTIQIPDGDVNDHDRQGSTIPMIVLPDDDDDTSLPMISISAPTINVEAPAQRPLPKRAPPKSTPHCSPSYRQSNTLCAHCALPIAGRILSAAGERFHPGCFVCHKCDSNLELVAFYPEPESKREERVQRIQARQAGELLDEGAGEVDDGEETLRFYCHLDFHETFSPRCKSCKTPIEGEIVVACGAEWHAGHFFCAQCGDPFDSTTPFVEKDGYAWCVGCHTNRFSSKCKKCRKPVIDVVIKALGADWHNDCFRCMECNGNFDDGRYFLRDDSMPVCVRCEEVRLKS